MGPLEGVQDVLGVSQSTASTSAKDQELLLPAFRIVIPLQIKLKKKNFLAYSWIIRKKNLEHETNRFLLEQVGRKTQELRGNILILKVLKFTDFHQNMKLSKLVNFTAPSLTGY